MEIGSAEHRKLLQKSIWKMAFKTGGLGSLLGLALMAPSLLRENAFSTGLLYLGCLILGFSVVYSVGIAMKKQKQIKQSLAQFEVNQNQP